LAKIDDGTELSANKARGTFGDLHGSYITDGNGLQLARLTWQKPPGEGGKSKPNGKYDGANNCQDRAYAAGLINLKGEFYIRISVIRRVSGEKPQDDERGDHGNTDKY
jgi:hypothetical protein